MPWTSILTEISDASGRSLLRQYSHVNGVISMARMIEQRADSTRSSQISLQLVTAHLNAEHREAARSAPPQIKTRPALYMLDNHDGFQAKPSVDISPKRENCVNRALSSRTYSQANIMGQNPQPLSLARPRFCFQFSMATATAWGQPPEISPWMRIYAAGIISGRSSGLPWRIVTAFRPWSACQHPSLIEVVVSRAQPDTTPISMHLMFLDHPSWHTSSPRI